MSTAVVVIAGQKFAAVRIPSQTRPHATVRVYVGGKCAGEGTWSPTGAGIVGWHNSTLTPHPILSGESQDFRPETVLEELSMALHGTTWDRVPPVRERVMAALRGGAVFAAMGVSVGFEDGHWWTRAGGMGQRTDEDGAWLAARAAFDTDAQMEAELARLASEQ